MAGRNTRRALSVVGAGALALLAYFASSLASKPSTVQGAAPDGALPPAGPTWEQLMGRSVQARKAGAAQDAETLLEQATALADSFDTHDMRRAHTRMAQAEFYLWRGQGQLAEQAYKDAVKIGEATGGAMHPEMVSLLEGLANFYYYRERYDEVVPVFTRILTIVRAGDPQDPHEEARRLRNLAQVELLRGRPAQAASFHLQALEVVEASSDRYPGELAEFQQAAAEGYLAWGRAVQAESLAARALQQVETLAGPESLDAVAYLKTLADARLLAGRPESAATLYQRGIAILQRVDGAAPSDLTPFLQGLGTALRNQGRSREADIQTARAQGFAEQLNKGEIDERSSP